MNKQFTHLGFNNWVSIEEIDAVQVNKGAPATRYIQEARQRNVLLDVTQGRKVKSIIVLKSGNIIVSAMAPDTIVNRISGIENSQEVDPEGKE